MVDLVLPEIDNSSLPLGQRAESVVEELNFKLKLLATFFNLSFSRLMELGKEDVIFALLIKQTPLSLHVAKKVQIQLFVLF